MLGRKNGLFAGSEAAAHRTAILCSLVQTCKHLHLEPFTYLRDVISWACKSKTVALTAKASAEPPGPAALDDFK